MAPASRLSPRRRRTTSPPSGRPMERRSPSRALVSMPALGPWTFTSRTPTVPGSFGLRTQGVIAPLYGGADSESRLPTCNAASPTLEEERLEPRLAPQQIEWRVVPQMQLEVQVAQRSIPLEPR